MSTPHQGWFTGTDGHQVYFYRNIPDAPRAVLLLNHGYAEHAGRYLDLMQFFADHGVATFAQDHRGHGRTAVVLGDLDSMDAVLSDLGVLHRHAIEQCPGVPVFIFGHSMGGLISLLYTERTDDLAGGIYNGAAIDIPDDVPPMLLKVAKILAKIAPRLGVQPFYDPESLTHDGTIVAKIESDPLFYKGKLRARTGDQLIQSIRLAVAALPRITIPFLATHGTEDTTVPIRTSEMLFGGASSTDKSLHYFEGMRHEVHNELDRQAVWDYWWAWLESHL